MISLHDGLHDIVQSLNPLKVVHQVWAWNKAITGGGRKSTVMASMRGMTPILKHWRYLDIVVKY